MLSAIRISIMLLFLLTIITGVIYPLTITGIAQIVFPEQANGSLIVKDGQVVGSKLIGQPFDDPKYFWSRPSATGPYAYNAAASSGSNLGTTNSALSDAVEARVKALHDADANNKAPVPVDLVTASVIGLDPHISVAAATYQISRVARERKMAEAQVKALVDQFTEGRTFGVLGDPRVNVLLLNLALDKK
jgi:K+-transporting ATPase ATPase C chain